MRPLGSRRPTVAVAGAGTIGRWHAYYARRAGADVVAIVEADAERRAEVRRRYAGGRAYSSLGACLQAEVLDAVHVCTPSATHAALARAALEAGVHALVEKPLAASAPETRSLVELAERSRVILAPVHQLPFQRGFRRVVDRLERLGPLVEVAYTTFSAGGEGRAGAQRRELLFEILPHPLSLFGRLGVDVGDVRWRLPTLTDDELELHGEHGQTLLRARVGLRARPTRNQLVLYGERATAHVDLFHGFGFVVGGDRATRARKLAHPFAHGAHLVSAATTNAFRRATTRELAYPGLRELIEAFYAAIGGRAPAPVAPPEATAVADVIERLRATPP